MDHTLLQKVLEKIAQNASKTDLEGYFPEKEFEMIRMAGLLSVTLPGKSLSFALKKTTELLMLLKRIGKASLPVGRIYEGHINALHLICLYGKPEQQARWYKDAGDHKKLFGVWNTQESEGVRIYDFGNGKYRLKGSKTFCSGAGWIHRPLITGKLISPGKTGWQMCIVPTEKVKAIKTDSSFWNPLGMRASASFKMDFSGIELTEKDLLGPPDAYYKQPYFGAGAIRFAAVQLGAAEAILEETHNFLRDLNRTGDPIQQNRMAEISCLVETGNLWIKQAGTKSDQWLGKTGETGQVLAYANMTRTVIEDICLRCMQLAERSVGVRSLMKPHPLERIHRDLTTFLRQPAPDAALTSVGAYVLNKTKTTNLWE